VPQAGVGRVSQVEIGPLPVPHLPPRIPGISQNGGDGAQRPSGAGAVRIPARVRRRRARHPRVIKGPGDPGSAVPGQPLREHPPHDVCCFRVRLKPVGTPSPGRVRLVRVRPRIGEPVPVRRAPTQVPALFQGLSSHRGADPYPRPGDLPLR
jgi:hypothetical protein